MRSNTFSRVPVRRPYSVTVSRTAVAFVFVCKSTFLLHEKLKTSRPASGIVIVPRVLHPLHADGRTFFIRLDRSPLPVPPPPPDTTSRSVWSINTRHKRAHIHTAGKRSVGTTTSRPLFTVLRRYFQPSPPPPLLSAARMCFGGTKRQHVLGGGDTP